MSQASVDATARDANGRRAPTPPLLTRYVAYTALLLAACRSPSGLVGPAEWEGLLTLPNQAVFQLAMSPDSVLFAGGPGFLMRAHLSRPTEWERVAQPSEAITQIFAPSGSTVFALTQSCNRVFRWDEAGGWRESPTPVRDTAWRDGDHLQCIHFHHMWGRSANDVYAAGSAGTILHYDGASWTVMPTPYTTRAERFGIVFMSVTGDDASVVVSGYRILRLRDGHWAEIPQPTAPPQCESIVSAMTGGDALFAYNSCILRLREGAWSVYRPAIEGFRGSIYDGRTQLDGSALFWSYEGDVAAVRGDHLASIRFEGFSIFGGAVSIGSHLYVGGLTGRNGVVARVRW